MIAEQDPSAAADAAEDDDLIFYMMWLAVIAFFWVSNLFAAIGTITMSRAVADNYWHDPEADEPLSLSPTLSALKGTLVYHLGSAIFGALVIAIVNLVRAILQYDPLSIHPANAPADPPAHQPASHSQPASQPGRQIDSGLRCWCPQAI